MSYSITCTCGDKVSINASNNEEAVEKMMVALDAHISSKDHPEGFKEMSEDDKRNMVREEMVSDE